MFTYIFDSIFLAFIPNLIVDIVYSNYYKEVFKHKIIKVLELPPKDDLNIFVNDEFLNGTCDLSSAFI